MNVEKKTATLLASSAVAALLLSGCAHNVVPSKSVTAEVRKAGPHAPSHYRSSYVGGPVRDGWLQSFRDPTLDKLVVEAQRQNPDLMLAASRVEKAAAMMQLTHAGMMPQLDINGNALERNWDYNYKDRDNRHYRASAYFSLSWEPDLWGRLANELNADAETTVATLADYEWARQTLSASTARAWFLLGSDKMIADFYAQLVRIQKTAQSVLEKRAKIGQGNMRDVHMIRGMVAEAEDGLQSARMAREQDTRALETLIGRYPGNLIKAHNLRAVSGRVPAGVPLELLNRRPDIIAAQYRVASAFHNTEAMRLLRLPSIRISAQLGVDTIQQTLAKLIGGLFMPVYDAGKIQAKIDAATADQRAALAAYKKTVLNAYREVENALANDRYLARRYHYLNTMATEYKTAYVMTDKNYKIGQGSILDVLQAQSKWINAKILRTQVMKERLINRVNLHLALGGSFDRK
ncbi:efflux transporter outer membrane subunit [Nitratifractor sp.]|uniref:efflux transporter outer membrane subunit n=1 Tax=Nitratifractor sp. TaxID=2268144 RepID=UPI0025CC518F|nr:efflux transporter outer membrane subunit [Nitratifractor sp.]